MGWIGGLAAGLTEGLQARRRRRVEDEALAREIEDRDFTRKRLLAGDAIDADRNARDAEESRLRLYSQGFKPADASPAGPSLQGLRTHDMGRLGALFDRVREATTPGQVSPVDLGPKLTGLYESTMRPRNTRIAGTGYVFDQDDNLEVREEARQRRASAESERRALTLEQARHTGDLAEIEARTAGDLQELALRRTGGGTGGDPAMKYNVGNGLRDDFQRLVKPYELARTGYQQMIGLAQERSGPGDVNLLIAAAKVADPESVVREGEVAIQRMAASLAERIGAKWQNLLEGDMLTDSQRASLVRAGAERLKAHRQSYERYRGQYGQLAKRYGGDEWDVVGDDPESPALGAPSGGGLDLQTYGRPPLRDFIAGQRGRRP